MTRKQNRDIKFLTHKDLNILFKSIESTSKTNKFMIRDLLIFNLAYYCGLRISEIALIKRENYNQHTKEIYIKRLKGSLNSTIKLDTKREKLIHKYLKEFPKSDDETLFSSCTGKPLEKASIEYLTTKYSDISGLHGFHFHMLKHSIAVHLLEVWLSLFELKNYLWHKSIDSTLVYSTFTKQMSEEMYKKINSQDLLA